MKTSPLETADYDLIKAAQSEFLAIRSHNWHGVASALRLKSGAIISGMVLEAENPSLTICAEPITIGKALDHIHSDPIVCIVAVRDREETEHKVIPPCGRCREFITDYAQDAYVIIHSLEENTLIKVLATDLLPFKYKN
ncbi:MAG: cytidine deaminase [Micavibrio aeruginosavorus]|uniref:Cytidine deaminase n=1 Tax=Micavibrio aeruginosavorus TaxID=349221 RepID=A0A7T5R0T0_9BACT|nr:MAG: cytidine deaminase [Micavibrio aeruginosavorus]